MNKPLIKITNLSVEYSNTENKFLALDNINLDIFSNQFTIIYGQSGCGKTTLLNCIGGILTPKQGEIIWNGKDITKMTDKEKTNYRRDNVGFIFQKYNLINDLNTFENILVSSSLCKEHLDENEVIKLMGLESKKDYLPCRMSGGEQQRVCIARAIVKKPQILLCDEPTGALDNRNADAVINLLKKFSKETDMAVIVITHNTNYIKLAEHLIEMKDGKVIKDEIINNGD